MAYVQLRDRFRLHQVSVQCLVLHILAHDLQQLESVVCPQAEGVAHLLKGAGSKDDWESDHHSGSSLGWA
jgi:hypothetical protein